MTAGTVHWTGQRVRLEGLTERFPGDTAPDLNGAHGTVREVTQHGWVTIDLDDDVEYPSRWVNVPPDRVVSA